MAGKYRTGAYTGTETVVFRTGLNTGRTGPVSPVPGYIPDFGQKLDTGPGKKKRKRG